MTLRHYKDQNGWHFQDEERGLKLCRVPYGDGKFKSFHFVKMGTEEHKESEINLNGYFAFRTQSRQFSEAEKATIGGGAEFLHNISIKSIPVVVPGGSMKIQGYSERESFEIIKEAIIAYWQGFSDVLPLGKYTNADYQFVVVGWPDFAEWLGEHE